MANNDEPWVDEQLASIRPHDDWTPDSDAALGRLRAMPQPPDSRRRVIAIGAFASAAVALSLIDWQDDEPTPTAEIGARPILADFELSDSSGARARLSDYRGRVVLLNFWATWCRPCRTEIPWFCEFEDSYGAQGFAVLGVSCDEEGWQVVQPFLEQQKVNYRVVLDDQQVAASYDVTGLPVTLLIDRQGRLAAAHRGLVPREGLETEIAALVAE